MVLKLSGKVKFLQFYTDFSKKSKSIKVLYWQNNTQVF